MEREYHSGMMKSKKMLRITLKQEEEMRDDCTVRKA